jgi:NADH-quinone oxidoreductase subunit H
MRWSFFFMAEYARIIVVAAVATTLFLGGWMGPFLPGPVWFFIKVFAIVFFFIWERGTFPRLRYDHIMQLGWKVLFPLALLNVVATAFVVAIK